MNFRSILVHLDATPASIERHAVAYALADRFGAKVTVLFGLAEAAPPAYAYSAAAALRAAEERDGPDVVAREQLYIVHRERDPDGIWCDVGPDLGAALVAEAAYADLLVLGPPETANATGAAPSRFVESSILQSGAPALVVPHPHRHAGVGDRILIAWDGSVPAARAVRSALPFLRSAKEVHVASWSRRPARAPLSRLGPTEWLQRHGIRSELHLHDATAHVGDALGTLAQALKADLIVLGCYGHSPLRERVFGGVTRSVLMALPAPLLTAH